MNEDAQMELEDALKKAYSYESRAGWGAQDLTTAFVGTVDKGERVYSGKERRGDFKGGDKRCL